MSGNGRFLARVGEPSGPQPLGLIGSRRGGEAPFGDDPAPLAGAGEDGQERPRLAARPIVPSAGAPVIQARPVAGPPRAPLPYVLPGSRRVFDPPDGEPETSGNKDPPEQRGPGAAKARYPGPGRRDHQYAAAPFLNTAAFVRTYSRERLTHGVSRAASPSRRAASAASGVRPRLARGSEVAAPP
jgi:hypothetical protein